MISCYCENEKNDNDGKLMIEEQGIKYLTMEYLSKP